MALRARAGIASRAWGWYSPRSRGCDTRQCILPRGPSLIPGRINAHSFTDKQRMVLDAMDLEACRIIHSIWTGSTFSRRTDMSTTKRMVLVIGIAVFGLLAISALHRVEAQLSQEDFVSLATQGFLTAVDGDHPEGSRRNSYMWSMRWWNDTLYVGTLRDAVCLFMTSGGRPPGYETVCPPPGVFLTPEQR